MSRLDNKALFKKMYGAWEQINANKEKQAQNDEGRQKMTEDIRILAAGVVILFDRAGLDLSKDEVINELVTIRQEKHEADKNGAWVAKCVTPYCGYHFSCAWWIAAKITALCHEALLNHQAQVVWE